jgi:hypothetical protein
VVISAEVDGTRAPSSEVVLPPNSSVALELKTSDDWFPASARIKENGPRRNHSNPMKAPNAGIYSCRNGSFPFKAHLNSTGEFWHHSGLRVCPDFPYSRRSLLDDPEQIWVPNRLRRAGVEEQLSDLARKTTSLSNRIDSGLRVFLRVERNRLHRLLRSQWIFSANYPDLVKRVGDHLAG